MTVHHDHAPKARPANLELCYAVLAVLMLIAVLLVTTIANNEADTIHRLNARVADAPSALVCFDAGGVPISALSGEDVFHECKSVKVLTDDAN